jgi:isoleucyl-tRNA synthetase
VHLLTFPFNLGEFRDDALAAKWDTIRNVRRVVTGALELERAAKNIGSSLEASPVIYVADRKLLATLFDVDLAEICITSNYEVREGEAPAGAFRLDNVPGVAVVVEKAEGTKCARSWKILPTVGEDPEYPDVSPRDARALREWRALHEPSAAPEPSETAIAPLERAPPIVPQSPAQVEETTIATIETTADDEPAAVPIDPPPAPKKRAPKSAMRDEKPEAEPSDDATEQAAPPPRRAVKSKHGNTSAKPTAAKKPAKKPNPSKAKATAKTAKKAAKKAANKAARKAKPSKAKSAKPAAKAKAKKPLAAKKAKKRKTR